MNVVFIIMMVVGVLIFAASFFLSGEDEEENITFGGNASSKSIHLSSGEPAIQNPVPEVKEEPANAVSPSDAIEAAKKKAREAVNTDYKFDLHLTDSTDRTVEELEHDLLGGLNLDEGTSAENKATAQSSKGGNNNSGKGKKGGNSNSGSNSGNNSGKNTGSNNGNSSGNNSASSKNNGGGKKKDPLKNDRYDELLYIDDNAADGTAGTNSGSNNSSNSGGNKNSGKGGNKSKGGKKGKKK